MKKTLFILLSPLAYLVYLGIYFYKAFFKAGHALRHDWRNEFCKGDRHPSNRGPVFIGPNGDANQKKRHDWRNEFCKGDRHPSNRGPVFIGPNGDANQKKRHRRGHRGGKKHRKHFHHGS